jgi:hypothetical protein
VALGSGVLGVGLVRSGAVPLGGALLVGLCGPAGMALLTVADLADQPSMAGYSLVRIAGFVAMVLYGGGWLWLGESLWRR